MSEKKEILFNLLKSILFGLLFPTVFCWFFIWDPIEKDFRLIVQKKIVTNGIITKAKFFEDVVESYDEEYLNVDGYEFSYTFFQIKAKVLQMKVLLTENYRMTNRFHKYHFK